MKYFKELVAELKALDLKIGEFAVFGSGPMAVRGIRDVHDLDIIVKKDLWKELLKKYPLSLSSCGNYLKIGNIEVYKDWIGFSGKTDKIINSAQIIKKIPYIQLKYVIEWKEKMKRKKDLKDLELIEKYNKLQICKK
jgi:hypothetical protein